MIYEQDENQIVSYVCEDGCELTVANAFAAGIDLKIKESVKLRPGASKAIGTGVKIEIPHGLVGFVRGRSGMAFRKNVWCFEGTIDSDYRGEISVLLMNNGVEEIELEKGMRVAQLVIVPYVEVTLRRVTEECLSKTNRGDNGLGSTGF